jgi:hypothetical protein
VWSVSQAKFCADGVVSLCCAAEPEFFISLLRLRVRQPITFPISADVALTKWTISDRMDELHVMSGPLSRGRAAGGGAPNLPAAGASPLSNVRPRRAQPVTLRTGH